MTPAARCEAAIQILFDYNANKGSLAQYFETWARRNRYAGSKDRRFIKELVFTIFRRRLEIEFQLGLSGPRALVMGGLKTCLGFSATEVDELFDGSKYGPASLSVDERQALCKPVRKDLPAHVSCNIPDWLFDKLAEGLAVTRDELAQLQERAPVELRRNTAYSSAEAHRVLEDAGIETRSCAYAPCGRRLVALQENTANVVSNSRALRDGYFELQDESSQIAALLVDAAPTHHVLDYCGGAGGKSLAIAGQLNSSGRIVCADTDPRRLGEARRRAKRADADCTTFVHLDGSIEDDNAPYPDEWSDAFDRVVADVPCSGSGAWRRRPETKWELTEKSLHAFAESQQEILRRAAPCTKVGGRLVYMTCSLIPQENTEQVRRFLASHADFRALSVRDVWTNLGYPALPERCFVPICDGAEAVTLAPWLTETDGFFVAILERVA